MNLEEILGIDILSSELDMTNFSEFRSAVQTYGFSLNNFYDVIFEINSSSQLYRTIVSKFSEEFGQTVRSTTNLMRLYTDECTIPGIQMSTGEYRINNSPQLKYAYGSVFSESSFSFIMDANSTIKKVFDLWTAFMYGYAVNDIDATNSRSHRLRTRYRDDYAIDIVIVKYEKPPSSKKNFKGGVGLKTFTKREIIPDYPRPPSATDVDEASRFYKAVPVHSTRMFKAFPSNIASVPLNSGSSALNKLSVTFEYETFTTSALTGSGRVFGNILDPVNG